MLVFLIIIPIVIILLVTFNIIIPYIFNYSINNYESNIKSKMYSYECGFNPIGKAKQRFYINYYLIAILYLIFDLEIVILIPYLLLSNISLYNYCIMIYIILLLIYIFIYEFKAYIK